MSSYLKTSLLEATLWHSRKGHSFTYRYTPVIIDLDDTKTPDWLSIKDNDFLETGEGCLKTRVLGACGLNAGKVFLVTSTRVFGYVFNPVSFFLVFSNGKLSHLIAEVNNTFKQRHTYVVENTLESSEIFFGSHIKEFHVSPFAERIGEYEFEVEITENRLKIVANLKGVIKTGFQGIFREPKFSSALFGQLLTMPRIIKQAAALKFQKELPVFSKPVKLAKSREFPTVTQRLTFVLMERFLDRLQGLHLVLRLPDGTRREYGPKSAPVADIKINSWDFFKRVSLGGDVGFGECYVDGLFGTDDLENLLTLLVSHKNFVQKDFNVFTRLGKAVNRRAHSLRKNCRRRAKENISAHYDLPVEFYKSFLDEKMNYSSAVFNSEHSTLEEAQDEKLELLCSDARLQDTDKVLEIGCGWGGFATYAARTRGCKIDAVTLSKEQFRFLHSRLRDESLEDRVMPVLADYRELGGQYDKIVSIEMVEAVGKEFLASYFEKVGELLKPGGLFVMQAITMPQVRYEKYLKRSDWIQKHIFPGGHIPSLNLLIHEASLNGHLVLENARNIRESYARTLGEWKERVFAGSGEVEDERFLKTWDYYLSYCKVGFEQNLIDTHQITFVRAP